MEGRNLMSEDLTKKMPDARDNKSDELIKMVQAVRAELSDLRNTVETRLYDTCPIWEKVSADVAHLIEGQRGLTADIAQLIEGQEGLKQSVQNLTEGQHNLTQGQQGLTEELHNLKESQQSLKEGQEDLRGEVREIRTHLRDMDRRLSIFNDTLVGIQADYRDIYDRVRGIERQRT